MNTAEALVKLLENDGVDSVFGHPGEQILSFYKALSKSFIKHILTRHEQGAIHAADNYARSSGRYGVAIATAGPGAMNLVMGVATAFKDHVPLLVITGDNDYSSTVDNKFQSFPINNVFKNMTVRSFHPPNGRAAISNFKEALRILKTNPIGPVHINLSKDVLIDEDIDDIDLGVFLNSNINPEWSYIDTNIELAIKKLSYSKKPLIIVGNGVVWGQAIELLHDFVSKYNVPIVTTYPARGVISENNRLNLGMVGLRGNSLSYYAYLNSDCIIVLGARLSERTIAKSENFEEFSKKIIHVNINEKDLKGRINICVDVYKFLEIILNKKILDSYNQYSAFSWIDKIYSHEEELVIEGIEDIKENYNPLRPQYAINKIIGAFENNYTLSDAGTHTTWTTLLKKCDKFGKLLFSGGFGPMGFALPGAIGVAIAHPNEKIIVICGDGDIQMVSQELATINEYNLNISIFVINNSQLGIIRQWEEEIYDFDFKYQVDLKNPDFLKLARAYGISSIRCEDKNSLNLAIEESLKEGPYLVDVIVREENIPMPK